MWYLKDNPDPPVGVLFTLTTYGNVWRMVDNWVYYHRIFSMSSYEFMIIWSMMFINDYFGSWL